jgi:hypothetical protein
VTKYHFVLVDPQRLESHIRLGEFPKPERAFQLAELIVSDLSIEDGGKWCGWTLEVRSTEGQRLFAVPVTGYETRIVDEATVY